MARMELAERRGHHRRGSSGPARPRPAGTRSSSYRSCWSSSICSCSLKGTRLNSSSYLASRYGRLYSIATYAIFTYCVLGRKERNFTQNIIFSCSNRPNKTKNLMLIQKPVSNSSMQYQKGMIFVIGISGEMTRQSFG